MQPQLAQAFDFTAEDLAANREGYLTWRQRDFFDLVLRHWVRELLQALGRTKKKKRKPDVVSICGRIQLEHRVDSYPAPRNMVFQEHHLLKFRPGETWFSINGRQYRLLDEGATYRVYYRPRPRPQILSIERVRNCDEY